MLTTAQEATLRTDVTNNPDLDAIPKTKDGFYELARLYNLAASPAFTVWRTDVSTVEIGNAIDATELDGLTQLKILQLEVMLSFGPVNASVLNRRDFFNKVFSGANGTNTRPALLAVSKRFATRIEKTFATGTGSDAVPATMTFEGAIDQPSIAHAYGF